MLHYEVGVNSAAKPMRHRQVLCDAALSVGYAATAPQGEANTEPSAVACNCRNRSGKGPTEEARSLCFDASIRDVGKIYPIKFFEEGYKFRVAELGENFLIRKFPCIVPLTRHLDI